MHASKVGILTAYAKTSASKLPSEATRSSEYLFHNVIAGVAE